jgi:hypothetical protein
MGLFDGGDSAKNNARLAADKQKKHQKKAKKQISKGEKRATAALDRAQTIGTAALDRGETKGIESLDLGYDRARTDLQAGKDEVIGYISQGKEEALGKQQQALDLYQPLMEQANKGAGLYGDFYGLGGAEGQAAAQQNWEGSPLYKAMVGESTLGQQALDRQAAGRGNRYNAADTLQYQGQLAGKYLNDYTSGLRPYLDQQGNLVGQQANIYGNMANTIMGAAGQMGGYAYGTGQDLGNLGYNTGVQQSGVYTGTAGRLSDLSQGIGTTQATGVNMPAAMGRANVQQNMGQTEADMYGNIVAANNAANQNKWGLINAGIGAAGQIGSAYAKGLGTAQANAYQG